MRWIEVAVQTARNSSSDSRLTIKQFKEKMKVVKRAMSTSTSSSSITTSTSSVGTLSPTRKCEWLTFFSMDNLPFQFDCVIVILLYNYSYDYAFITILLCVTAFPNISLPVPSRCLLVYPAYDTGLAKGTTVRVCPAPSYHSPLEAWIMITVPYILVHILKCH